MLQRFSKILGGAFAVVAIPCFGLSQEVADFDEQVRQALLRHPEIILEVFAILEVQQETDQRGDDLALIEQYSEQLFGPDNFTSNPILVEFVDYQCGYCRQATSIVANIMDQNPDVQLRLIQLPILGAKSTEYAAKMLAISELYGAETYIEMHEVYLGGQGGELQNFDAVLEEHGLSPQRVFEVAQSGEIKAALASNLSLARSLGINGTPGFVTRLQIIRGFVQEQALLQAISGS